MERSPRGAIESVTVGSGDGASILTDPVDVAKECCAFSARRMSGMQPKWFRKYGAMDGHAVWVASGNRTRRGLVKNADNDGHYISHIQSLRGALNNAHSRWLGPLLRPPLRVRVEGNLMEARTAIKRNQAFERKRASGAGKEGPFPDPTLPRTQADFGSVLRLYKGPPTSEQPAAALSSQRGSTPIHNEDHPPPSRAKLTAPTPAQGNDAAGPSGAGQSGNVEAGPPATHAPAARV